MRFRKSAHTVYKTQYHIVWITRFRRILVTGTRRYLEVRLQEIRKDYLDWENIEIGIDTDHVHLLISTHYIQSSSHSFKIQEVELRSDLRQWLSGALGKVISFEYSAQAHLYHH